MLNRVRAWYDRFLFDSCSLATCAMLRISYAFLLVIYTLVWMADGATWFSDQGVMSVETARALQAESQWSIFFWLSATPAVIQICLSLLLLNAVLLLVGVFSRFQAAMIFFWLINFQHRNPLTVDGEDTVFRFFAFLLMLLPLDACCSLTGSWLRASKVSCGISPRAWAVRLFQIEMSLIYLSAAWSKFASQSWRDGSALYYVFQLGDLYGRFPLPALVTESEWAIRLSTWAVVAVEAAIPLLLWYRPTRKLGLLLGFGLHLAIEYAMHLFLFQWIMMVGLLSFVDPSQWKWLARTETSRETPQVENADQKHNVESPAMELVGSSSS